LRDRAAVESTTRQKERAIDRMTTNTAVEQQGFRHQALLYGGPEEFREGTLPFIHDGLSAGEAVLVVVDEAKIEMLRSELDGDADRVVFADMAQVGRNPARIIPLWRAFVSQHARNGGVRGIGEPAWVGRSPDELAECRIHEALLNVAFADAADFTLLCPYDAQRLEPEVVDGALCTHAYVCDRGDLRRSASYSEPRASRYPFDSPPPEPNFPPLEELLFSAEGIGLVRRSVTEHATASGLSCSRVAALVQCVHELAVNSVQHGGGSGVLRVWRDFGALVCEVRDAGRIEQPLVGREVPPVRGERGRGLWLVQQLADLAQVRSGTSGTVVRLHTYLG
jgi:anti-sigma regulatory factor (Ser/Thr protein kinase)